MALFQGSKFNLSIIAKAAWAAIEANYGPKNGYYRTEQWAKDRAAVLSYGFRIAWQQAHAEKAESERASQLSDHIRRQRIVDLQNQMSELQFLPLGMNAASRRADLQIQINQLAA